MKSSSTGTHKKKTIAAVWLYPDRSCSFSPGMQVARRVEYVPVAGSFAGEKRMICSVHGESEVNRYEEDSFKI